MKKTFRAVIAIAVLLLCLAALLLLWTRYKKSIPEENSAATEESEPRNESKTAPLPLESYQDSGTRESERTDSEKSNQEESEISNQEESEISNQEVSGISDREESEPESGKNSKQESHKSTEKQESSRVPEQSSAQESNRDSKPEENSQGGASGAYFCGNSKHSCRNAQEHEAMLTIEARGCPYCGRHDCPSFYATDKHGNQEFDFSLCPKYKAQEDPTKYCPYCGKSVIVDANHPPEKACWRWPCDANCPYCGGFVPANTCHSCPPGTKFQP